MSWCGSTKPVIFISTIVLMVNIVLLSVQSYSEDYLSTSIPVAPYWMQYLVHIYSGVPTNIKRNGEQLHAQLTLTIAYKCDVLLFNHRHIGVEVLEEGVGGVNCISPDTVDVIKDITWGQQTMTDQHRRNCHDLCRGHLWPCLGASDMTDKRRFHSCYVPRCGGKGIMLHKGRWQAE